MFFLVERPKIQEPQRGSPRMFRIDFLEKYLSRVRPWQIVALWAPITAGLLGYALVRSALDLPAVLGLAAAGVFFWTLLEYLLHRFAFHFPVNPSSELQRDLAFLIHGVHHDYPHDPDRLVMPPAASILIALVLGPLVYLAMGPERFPPAFAGLVGGYIWYDLTHYGCHYWRPQTAFGRMLRRHHLQHHFKSDSINYGISTPLWDRVFGTFSDSRATNEDPAAAS